MPRFQWWREGTTIWAWVPEWVMNYQTAGLRRISLSNFQLAEAIPAIPKFCKLPYWIVWNVDTGYQWFNPIQKIWSHAKQKKLTDDQVYQCLVLFARLKAGLKKKTMNSKQRLEILCSTYRMKWWPGAYKFQNDVVSILLGLVWYIPVHLETDTKWHVTKYHLLINGDTNPRHKTTGDVIKSSSQTLLSLQSGFDHTAIQSFQLSHSSCSWAINRSGRNMPYSY